MSIMPRQTSSSYGYNDPRVQALLAQAQQARQAYSPTGFSAVANSLAGVLSDMSAQGIMKQEQEKRSALAQKLSNLGDQDLGQVLLQDPETMDLGIKYKIEQAGKGMDFNKMVQSAYLKQAAGVPLEPQDAAAIKAYQQMGGVLVTNDPISGAPVTVNRRSGNMAPQTMSMQAPMPTQAPDTMTSIPAPIGEMPQDMPMPNVQQIQDALPKTVLGQYQNSPAQQKDQLQLLAKSGDAFLNDPKDGLYARNRGAINLSQSLAPVKSAILNGVQTGALADVNLSLGKVGQALGLPSDTSGQELITAIQNKLGPAQRIAGSGASSDRDVSIFMGSIPNLSTTPQGNLAIIHYLDKTSEYAKKVNDVASQLPLDKANESNLQKALKEKGLDRVFDDTDLDFLSGKGKTADNPIKADENFNIDDPNIAEMFAGRYVKVKDKVFKVQ